LQETYLRLKDTVLKEKIFFVTNEENFFNVFNQIRELEKDFKKDNIIIEPKSLNTAPAIALALKYLKENTKITEDESILILPSDHHIKDKNSFLDILKVAVKNIKDKIGIVGISPKKAETGYGYIKKSEKINEYFKVGAFEEKPDKERAKKYLASGDYLWNSGIYIFNLKTFERELKEHSKDIFEYFEKSYNELLNNFEKMPSVSIDCAISEKSENMIVFEGDFGWSDLGSFDALSDAFLNKENNKKYLGVNSSNVFTHSTSGYLIATSGVKDLIIIENNDSILVQKKGESENVKNITEILKEKNYDEIEHNVIVHRPWGKYQVLVDLPTYKVKKITVYPGAKLSLQSHHHRSEHWVVVRGMAKVVNGEKEFELQENESTYIPVLNKHRLSNPGELDLEIVEVQTGTYMGEDDIVRYDDIYERE
jgi:mannose-1-phosphate guanylyltransferase/mannose-6-phosphate isomerase